MLSPLVTIGAHAGFNAAGDGLLRRNCHTLPLLLDTMLLLG